MYYYIYTYLKKEFMKMYISMNTEELNQYFATFFKEKDLHCESFKVTHSFYGESEMPVSDLISALTHPQQSFTFMREIAGNLIRLDSRNASDSKFVEYFTEVAQELTESLV